MLTAILPVLNDLTHIVFPSTDGVDVSCDARSPLRLPHLDVGCGKADAMSMTIMERMHGNRHDSESEALTHPASPASLRHQSSVWCFVIGYLYVALLYTIGNLFSQGILC